MEEGRLTEEYVVFAMRIPADSSVVRSKFNGRQDKLTMLRDRVYPFVQCGVQLSDYVFLPLDINNP